MRFVETDKDRVVAELEIRPELPHHQWRAARRHADGVRRHHRRGRHGGEPRARPEHRDARVEDQFLRRRPLKGVVRAESTPLHKGKRTHVWQTRVTDAAGKLLSLTIQTQVIL